MNDKKERKEDGYSVQTKLIYGRHQTGAWDYSHHVVPPMTTSSSFRLDSAERGAEGFAAIGNKYPDDPGYQPIYVYDRMGEPNNDMLQQVLAKAEEKEVAVTFATGMAAISAGVCACLEQGDEVISHNAIYGCTYSLFRDWFPKFGFKVTFADFMKPDDFLEYVTERTKVIFLESPVNPTLDLIDLEAVMANVNKINAERSEDNKILVVMDNTFASPYCQRPGKYGVDVVVHSLTKSLCGFGTEMGGVVVTQRELKDKLILFRKDFGGVLSPSSAWHVLVYGVSTLPIRMKKQQETALKISRFLEEHPVVDRVLYPGLESYPQYEVAQRMLRDYNGDFAPGNMIYFVVKGDSAARALEDGRKVMNTIADNAYAVTLAVSLGQVRTLIEHPGSMTHAAIPPDKQVELGIDPGGIRVAVGIEEPEDIIKDLTFALDSLHN